MREIEFRAWHKNEMIYNCALIGGKLAIEENPKTSERIIVRGEHFYNDWATYKIYNSPLMQYTGLKDKNGVKIFEGDWVTVFSDGAIKTMKGKIEYSGSCFIINCFEGCYFDWMEKELEVIGNIYENPELLD